MSIKEISPPDWAKGKSFGHFLGCLSVQEEPIHYGCCHLWDDFPRIYNETAEQARRSKPHNQHPPWPLLPHLPPGFCRE